MTGASDGPLAILIGPMASGKTSVGRELARLCDVGFRDLDHEIVARSGRSIPELFAADGEDGFRALEAEVLTDLLSEHTGVLSLGGGAPLVPISAAALSGRPVVLLEIDAAIAGRRLHGGSGRPLIAGDDPLARWASISAARMPAYRALARHTVDAGDGTAAEVAARIRALLAHGSLAHPDSCPSQTQEQER